jgi:protease-4
MASQARGWLLGCGVFLLLLITGGIAVMVIALTLGGQDFSLPLPGPKVGVVEVFGVLGEDDDVLEQLDRFEDDGSIQALVLHINSPGGTVGTTQRIVARLDDFAEEGIPIVAALEDVAASGGYYVATAAESIFALPGTLTGSIGVIMSFPDVSALMKKIGIEYQVVKTGPYKDAGSPFRALTPEERTWIEEVLNDVYGQFLDAIVSSRPLAMDSLQGLVDGRFFSGSMARDSGLVDRLADLDEAILVAGRMAEIKGEPIVVRKRRHRRRWEKWLEERLEAVPVPQRGPLLEYRWR